jgi:hypothetical protein
MRRFAKLVLVAVTLMARPVLAEDPPPPPPASDTPGESTYRQRGALLDRSPQRRSQMLSVFLGLPYGYFFYGFPFGLGGRYLIPILQDGFLPSVNDEFSIEFGADLSGAVGARFYPTLGIPVEVLWNFHFTQKFSAYVKAGVVLEINFVPYACVGTVVCRGAVSASPIGNVGLMFKFSEKVSFRAEAGYPWIKVGLGFDM